MEQPVPEAQAQAGTADKAGYDDGARRPEGGGREAAADQGTLGAARPHRPVHLHPGFLLVVVAGGILGALARYGLGSILPAPGGWPVPTLAINLSGAFLLGLLLEALVRRGPDAGRLRLIRLFVGTGFMGAFTTYSTLALETNTLFGAGRVTDALLYVGVSVVAGAAATVAGIRLAAGHHARATDRRENRKENR
ncbi:fluoride efflux transporter FluC [Pseudarthrobacter sp. NPDC058196]|uniref:fluoride efflux transporter FluC n=1 Tax=Pseudarthrobacter sp. NPDC058196 TaxID=3346376 RepID=UPI0036DB5066